MWKKILIGVVVFIGLVFAIVMYATSGMSDVANEFFIYTKSKHFDDAYNMGSEDFKRSVTKEQLKNFLVQNALTEYKSASWTERAIDGNIGTLKGTITTKSGSVIPITMKFIKNVNGDWELYSIFKPAGGIEKEKPASGIEKEKPKADSSTGNQVPSQSELVNLVQETTMVFAQSVNDKSMEKLYNYISDVWKKETSIAQLDKVFDPFYKQNIDLTLLKDIKPIIDNSTKIDSNGILHLSGYYPTSPVKVYFKNEYIQENGKWKLYALFIRLKK